jgi:hypothetical protein
MYFLYATLYCLVLPFSVEKNIVRLKIPADYEDQIRSLYLKIDGSKFSMERNVEFLKLLNEVLRSFADKRILLFLESIPRTLGLFKLEGHTLTQVGTELVFSNSCSEVRNNRMLRTLATSSDNMKVTYDPSDIYKTTFEEYLRQARRYESMCCTEGAIVALEYFNWLEEQARVVLPEPACGAGEEPEA